MLKIKVARFKNRAATIVCLSRINKYMSPTFNELLPEQIPLIDDVRDLIQASRQRAVSVINAELTLLYWEIGKLINLEIVKDKRAEYGKAIISKLAHQLTLEYGRSFEEKNLRRMMQFANLFPDEKIVATLRRQLSWSHFRLLIPRVDL